MNRKTLTYADRERIFAKELITTAEISELWGMSLSDASILLQEIKSKFEAKLNKPLRCERRGKLHVQDYLEYFDLPRNNRYIERQKEEGNGKCE